MLEWLLHRSPSGTRMGAASSASYRPLLEALEDRWVPSTTTVEGLPNPGSSDFPITFKATIVGDPNSSSLNGTVTFFADGVSIGSVQVQAICNPPLPPMTSAIASARLAPGNHTITAVFKSNDSSQTNSQGSVTEAVRGDDNTDPPIHIRRFLQFKFGPHRVKETIKLTNPTGKTIKGPFYLILNGLNMFIQVDGAAGLTSQMQPLGSPYVPLSVKSIGPRKTVTVTLVFEDPLQFPISYTPRLITGTPPF
jgi:hypothetical protein